MFVAFNLKGKIVGRRQHLPRAKLGNNFILLKRAHGNKMFLPAVFVFPHFSNWIGVNQAHFGVVWFAQGLAIGL